jgi:hypothetical protein
MTRIATKLGVGIAGCAIAASASLMSVPPAQAAPVAPAAPVVLGPADVPLDWWGSPRLSSPDLLGSFRPVGDRDRIFDFDDFFHFHFFPCYPHHI